MAASSQCLAAICLHGLLLRSVVVILAVFLTIVLPIVWAIIIPIITSIIVAISSVVLIITHISPFDYL